MLSSLAFYLVMFPEYIQLVVVNVHYITQYINGSSFSILSIIDLHLRMSREY